EGVRDETEHDDGADAEPAAAHRQTQTAAAHAAAAIVATVLDVGAAAEIIVLHRAFSSLPFQRSSTHQQRGISIPLINSLPGKNCLARKNCRVKSIFTLPIHGVVSRLFSPASPTASPESEYLSHGCVASRGVCKGVPH